MKTEKKQEPKAEEVEEEEKEVEETESNETERSPQTIDLTAKDVAKEFEKWGRTLKSVVTVEKDEESGDLFYLVEWDGDDSYYRVPSTLLRKQYPESVLQYLESIIKWGKSVRE